MALPEGEQSQSIHENEAQLTPRQELEKFLNNENAGSTPIQALSDLAAFQRYDAEVDLAVSPTSSEYIQAAIRKGQVEETKRRREFGQDAAAYVEAWEEGLNIFKAYRMANLVAAPYQPHHTEQVIDPRRTDLKASGALLDDLRVINISKSRSKPPTPNVSPSK